MSLPASSKQSSNAAAQEMDLSQLTALCVEAIVDAYHESEAYEVETTYDLDQLFGEKERVVTSKTLSDIPFEKQLVPITVLTIVSINNTFFSQPVVALIDSGSQSTLIQKRVLPKTLLVSPSSKSLLGGVTGQGSLIGEVLLTNFMLPELSPTKRIDSSLMAGVIDTQATYDVVLGLDFLCQFKIDNLNLTQEIQWLDHKLEYHP
jgi:Retroviral aspartyl protease